MMASTVPAPPLSPQSAPVPCPGRALRPAIQDGLHPPRARGLVAWARALVVLTCTLCGLVTLPARGAAQPAGVRAEGIADTSPWRGAAEGAVTMVVVSDFQCPFCARVDGTLQQLLADYPRDLRMVWFNQPLPFHRAARPAALAALAAHRQGKFWQMHDLLFARQRQLEGAPFDAWAKELGLDIARFRSDRQDAALAEQLDRERAAAQATRANGTPTFFINGKKLQGAQPIEVFREAIDAARADAQSGAAGQKGLEQMRAAANKTAGTAGTKVVAAFFEGDVAKDSAAAQAQDEDDDGPSPPAVSPTIYRVPVDLQRDAWQGTDAALVTLVTFSDFQCPFCKRTAATLQALRHSYGDKVRLVFKHFPLPFHPQARAASLAAIAAARQGKFWPFHDKCFAHDDDWNDALLTGWATELGLDLVRFAADRQHHTAAAQVDADLAVGAEASVRGTPTTFINGRAVSGAQPIEVFRKVIDEEIAKHTGHPKRGQALYEELIAHGRVHASLGEQRHDFALAGLPQLGKADAAVTVVVFSDFECPYCAKMAATLDAVLAAAGGRVRLVFAHYPLSFHPGATDAAVLAQLAYDQGGAAKFRAVHDDLFAAQRNLSEATLAQLAKKHGIAWSAVRTAIASGTYTALLQRTQQMGQAAGLEGTPTVFINGRKFEPADGFTVQAFVRAIAQLKP
jgi:protein-disulfide isomerase